MHTCEYTTEVQINGTWIEVVCDVEYRYEYERGTWETPSYTHIDIESVELTYFERHEDFVNDKPTTVKYDHYKDEYGICDGIDEYISENH